MYGYLIDMDGVIYRDNVPVAKEAAFLARPANRIDREMMGSIARGIRTVPPNS